MIVELEGKAINAAAVETLTPIHEHKGIEPGRWAWLHEILTGALVGSRFSFRAVFRNGYYTEFSFYSRASADDAHKKVVAAMGAA